MYLPASPTAYRKELAHRELVRLEQLDQKLDRALALVRMEVGATAPAFPTEDDIETVGKQLVEGRVRLPTYARITVITEVEERKDPIFGTSTTLTHTADQLCCHQMQPMSIQAAIEVGLLVRLSGSWRFSEAAYKRLVPPDARLLP